MQQFDVQSFLEDKPPNNKRFFTIAIDGRGGSGKTVLANYLNLVLTGFTVLNGDDYFEPTPNGDTWGGFNEARLEQEVLQSLRQGAEKIPYSRYDWDSGRIVEPTIIFTTGGICLERCYSLEMNVPWDLKIWVETPKELCLERGLAREDVERDKVEKAWRDVWWPTESKYIARFDPAKQADIVLNGTQEFSDQIV